MNELLQREEEALATAARLLSASTPWHEWPQELLEVLELALHGRDVSQSERWKQRALVRHLFANAEAPDLPAATEPTTLQQRQAERLRADLPALVRLRAGVSVRT